MNVSALDYAVLGGYLLGCVLFGVWVGRGQRDETDYMLGGRDLPWWGLLLSIVATETSTVTFLSIPGFAFSHDMSWLQLALGFLLGRFVVVALLLPQYFSGRFFTAYEVLERRFGGATKRTASALFIVTRSLADGLRLFLTAIVLQELAGMPLGWAIVLAGATTILYTFFGGMRAVVWTDVIQFVIYIAGALLAFAVLLRQMPGGWAQVVAIAGPQGHLRVLDLSFDLSDPYVLWAGLFGGLFLTLGSHGADQLMVQRYFCARSQRDAGRALALSGFVVFAQFTLFLLIGVGLRAFYTLNPPAQPFDHPDRVFVRFIVDHMPMGALGLVLGAVFAAAMSTLSSSLNSSATAMVKDLFGPAFLPHSSPRQQLRLTRLFTLVFGAVQMGVALAGRHLNQSVVASVLTIAGFTTGIILGVFFLGTFTKDVGQRSALVGMLLGLAGMSLVCFGTSLAWPWYALVGSLGTFALGLIASRLWPEPRPSGG
jgi:solute:Na+ symporter, SSS family